LPTSPLTPSPRLLADILRALPQGELASLISRLGIRIDAAKRIDAPSQVARALVSLPELRDPSRLSPASVELLHRVAEARGMLLVETVPPALEPLLARGLMFARGDEDGVELILPAAYLVQLKTWEGEDPRGIRALLAQASFETMSAIAAHYLGRPATPPIALSLETAWEILGDPGKLSEEISKLSATERRVLDGVAQDGGEVDTEELLELEREPLRLRTATGATPSRRGVGFSLERRGLLIPVHPNRHVVPTEVSTIIGAAHQTERETRREKVRAFVVSGDHAPRRARFSLDPAPLVLGIATAAREAASARTEARPQSGTFADLRAGVGTPKSLLQKMATRFGREQTPIALAFALSRALGLWDVSATNFASPPGSFTMQELTRQLFLTWQRGGAWDEARAEPEVLRLAPESRDSSPAGVVREMVLEALRELGEGRWVPWSSLGGWLKSDHRIPGLGRLFRRWAERGGVEPVEPLEVARRIVHESLPALGILDLGEDEDLARDPEFDGPAAAPIALRLTARGRALLADKVPAGEAAPSKFLDTHVLRLGPQARVGAILSVAPFVEVGRAAETLDLIIAPQRPSRRSPSRSRGRSRRRASSSAGRRGRLRPGSSGSRTGTCASCCVRDAIRRSSSSIHPPREASLWLRGSTSTAWRGDAGPSASRSSATARSCARAPSRLPPRSLLRDSHLRAEPRRSRSRRPSAAGGEGERATCGSCVWSLAWA
jgi:hypothetical protein